MIKKINKQIFHSSHFSPGGSKEYEVIFLPARPPTNCKFEDVKADNLQCMRKTIGELFTRSNGHAQRKDISGQLEHEVLKPNCSTHETQSVYFPDARKTTTFKFYESRGEGQSQIMKPFQLFTCKGCFGKFVQTSLSSLKPNRQRHGKNQKHLT